MSNRGRIILLSGLLIIVGAVLPVLVMSYVSWVQAIETEKERLKSIAEIAIARTNLAVGQSVDALRLMNESRLAPCSEAHIAQMRKMTVNTGSIEEIGYFSDGVLQCSSWGIVEHTVRRHAGDFIMKSGAEIIRQAFAKVAEGEPMMVIQLNDYNALMSTKRLVDLVIDRQVSLVIADPGGDSIAERNAPDRALIASLIHTPRDDMDDTYIYATAQSGGLMAIVVAPKGVLGALWHEEQLFYLPIAVLIDILLIALIIRYSRRLLSPLAELQIAIKKREFIVHYQPITDLNTGICVGAEALVRWVRPDGSVVRPDVFIPLAEEHGLVSQITGQVIGAVVHDLKKVLNEDRSLHIAINLSSADIKDGCIVPILQQHLDGSGIAPEQIWLEMTERGFMDIESARTTLAQVRALGHSTALDDFGTGYSSLQYLQGLPMDALKIDKSFVDTIGTASASSSVITMIIDMAKKLNMFIVAEGAETQEQVDFLKAHKVDFVQGWFYSKALSCNAFIDYYRQTQQQFGSGPHVIKTARVLSDVPETAQRSRDA